MFTLLKTYRNASGLTLREVAQHLSVDPSLVNRFETGERLPTESQISVLATVFGVSEKELRVAWLKHKLMRELEGEPYAIEALQQVQEAVVNYQLQTRVSEPLQEKLSAIDRFKEQIAKHRKKSSSRIIEALSLEYTYESNRIEGNTLTLAETELVINKGLTVSGKTMREHLEAINHVEAISFIRELAEAGRSFTERDLLDIHQLVLRGIDPTEAGRYRRVNVMISGASHVPPDAMHMRDEMDDFFRWYRQHESHMHPVAFAAESHLRLVSIHPFIDGNGRTSRLLMNLHLMRHGYPLCIIRGETHSRLSYYQHLDDARTGESTQPFVFFIADILLENSRRLATLLGASR